MQQSERGLGWSGDAIKIKIKIKGVYGGNAIRGRKERKPFEEFSMRVPEAALY